MPRKKSRRQNLIKTLEHHVHIYTDGSCSNGNGGWAFAFRDRDEGVISHSGGDTDTTNNRMEVQAVLSALQAFRSPERILIISDSRYALNGSQTWARKWKKNQWRHKAGPVKNSDLWKQILHAIDQHEDVRYQWVKGHSGVELNEICDRLAKAERKKHDSNYSQSNFEGLAVQGVLEF